jgi:hypothetical protein
MKLEDLKQEFPPMPEDIRQMIERTVAQQVAAPAPQRKKRPAGKTALLILAAALALSGTALAVTGPGRFYDLFFGTQAVTQDAADTVTVQPYDYTIYDAEKDTVIPLQLPGYELVAVDEAEADRLLGPYVQERNDSYTMDGYTVTILGYIQDEAGTYRLYYSIENPDGLDNISYYDYNGYTLVDPADWSGFRAVTGGNMAYADTARSTDTKVYICVPGTVAIWTTGADLTICSADQDREISLTVESDNLVPAVTAQGGNYTVMLSPMGLNVTQNTPYEYDNMIIGFELRYAAITFADGTEYVVLDEDTDNLDNTSYRCGGVNAQGNNQNELACFNRLIDPAQVVSVTVRDVLDEESTTIYFSE